MKHKNNRKKRSRLKWIAFFVSVTVFGFCNVFFYNYTRHDVRTGFLRKLSSIMLGRFCLTQSRGFDLYRVFFFKSHSE